MLTWFKEHWGWLMVIIWAVGIAWWLWLRPKPIDTSKLYTVNTTSLKQTLVLSGEIDAHEKVNLQFKLGGKLAWLGVKLGETVQPYQTIASLDQQEFQKRLQQTLNDYMVTRMNFDQTYQDTNRIGDQAAEPHDAMKRTRIKADNSLERSVLDIELQHITAQDAYLTTPIAGIVTRLAVNHAGINVNPQSGPLAQVINPNTFYFAAAVDQTEVVDLHEGMTAELSLDAFPDQLLTATISRIDYVPKSGETGTVYKVEMNISHTDVPSQLRLGMTGDATFTISERPDVLVIPQGYIVREGGKNYVALPNTKELRPIKTGESVDGMVEVTESLRKDDVITMREN